MRRVLGGIVVGSLVAAGMSAGPAQAAGLTFKRCGSDVYRCARVTVPLDRSGGQPGQVRLFVERARTKAKKPASPLVLFAGGPGQSASRAYGELGGRLAPILRRRDVIVFDQRGTGRSGLLRCPQLEKANILDARVASARCAATLGPKRAFYTSKDTADDLEQIRVALGVPKLALYGISYGTRTALSYAQRYPGSVDRMVLSSVVPVDGVDAFGLDSFSAVPRVLRNLCAGRSCRVATRNAVGDVAGLVRRLAARPAPGRVVNARGRSQRRVLADRDVFNVLVSGDFDPQLRAEFPAAVSSALRGDPAPMLRLTRRSEQLEGGTLDPKDLSAAVYAATTCEEATLPWPRTSPFAQRSADAAAAAQLIPEAALAPFDRTTALASDTISLCHDWPLAPVAPTPGTGRLPNVPTLLIEGNDDLRTPLESALAVSRQIPRSKLVSVQGVGHDPEDQGVSSCAEKLTPAFLAGRKVPSRCRDYRAGGATPRIPASLRSIAPIRGIRGARGRVLAAARLTLADVIDDVLFAATATPDARVIRNGGLRGGSYTYGAESGNAILRSVALVRGVRLSGRFKAFGTSRLRGTLRIAGGKGASGVLAVRGQRFRGHLGKVSVRGRFNFATASVASASSAADTAPRPRRVPSIR